MSNLKLFTISIITIAILSGTAHLFANIKNDNLTIQEPTQKVFLDTISKEIKPKVINHLQRYIGNWQVNYSSDEFTGKITYSLKLDGENIKGYITEVYDKDGNMEENNQLSLIIKSINKKKVAKGVYFFDYEKEKQEVSCEIKMISDSQLELSYSLQGYNGKEIWNKLTKK